MKKIYFVVVLLISMTSIYAQADKITGIWVPAKGSSQIRIFKATNGKYYGKVEWLKPEERNKVDENNPDASKRNGKILGSMILKDFTYNADKKRWEGGTVYDPDNGKTYDCYMWFDGDDNKMTLKGYVLGMKFVGRAEDWTRENEIRK